jgi:hypothetical protein
MIHFFIVRSRCDRLHALAATRTITALQRPCKVNLGATVSARLWQQRAELLALHN